VTKVIDRYYDGSTTTPWDYAFLQIVPPPGIPPLQLRPDLPDPNEDVFGVHHPNGAVRKLSVPHPDFVKPSVVTENFIQVPKPFHVSGGSSGSALFDTAGRVLGVLSNGNPCGYNNQCAKSVLPFDLIYYPSSSILKHITNPPSQPPVARDVMVVFDVSGSMLEQDSTGRTKIELARNAVSLFVQLIRKDIGNRIGLVSFSTSATSPVDFPIASVNDANKAVLVGSAPFSGGKVGALTPGGSTSIGDGLVKAASQLTPPSANPPTILLMTDGMENTPPLVNTQTVKDAIQVIQLHAVGFGKQENLDGPLLNEISVTHGGLYSNAETGVSLQKFFSQAFGNIFEHGIIKDPEYDLPAGQLASQPLGFNVCGEDLITVAVGWDNANGALRINLTTPAGRTITGESSGVEQAVGHG
jgi:von Willebrand factor type A domain/Trypsin-like peptidase domain